MIRAALALALLVLAPSAAMAEELLAGLSRNRVSISANFDGSEILIFGAVKREAPVAAGRTGIIVTVEGPRVPLTIRRKDRVGPIWINDAAMEVDAAPSFYAVNTSAPFGDILNHVDDLREAITVDRAIRAVGVVDTVPDPSAFTDALMRIRAREDLFQTNIGAVRVREDTLFDSSVSLPANLVEGIYTARIFLTRDGAVVSSASSAINVQKVGLERFLYTLAHEDPLVYGMMSLAIAIAAGWGASAAFRYF